jgi:hypothetical protein
MSISPFLTLEQPCEKVVQWANEQLTRTGLCSLQTFNLNTALSGSSNCVCPDHGTNKCDCQMVILFVYEQSGEPVTLILHGNGGQTWLSFAETPTAKPNSRLVNSIQQLLESEAAHFQIS